MDWITLAFQIGSALLGTGGIAAGYVSLRRTRAQAAVEAERARRHEAKRDATIATLDAEAEENEAQRVWSRLTVVEQRLDDCETKHARCEETGRKQGTRIADLERRLAERDEDVTRRVRLEVRRSTTPRPTMLPPPSGDESEE